MARATTVGELKALLGSLPEDAPLGACWHKGEDYSSDVREATLERDAKGAPICVLWYGSSTTEFFISREGPAVEAALDEALATGANADTAIDNALDRVGNERAAKDDTHTEGTIGWLVAELARFLPSEVVAVAGTEGFAHVARSLSVERDLNSGEALIVVSGDDWSRELVVPDAE